ncbi:MAG: YdiU family protein [Cognatishimia sp.]|uniref:protein adenylyltransferase SelO n=1 Tax=Cognatishimia sp. TaxID=2211648 RepID=UPI003B8D71AB
MSLSIPFANTYGTLPAQLFTRMKPTAVADPSLIAFNHDLAAELGIENTQDIAELSRVFGGNEVPQGADPLAQLYAAHQFGQWNPQLGDGRALMLGDVETTAGRFDIQLKGSGPTPYSRNGDGRAWLGPVLREYVMSEAMHALGIPTTRALAAVATGEQVFRETALPGAVITRVAASHIRVGTFQILVARRDLDGLQALNEHAVERHYPDCNNPLEFLQAVIHAQAKLVAKWMSIGFIHGVMNTDNCTVSGETIDYGPCAFMDEFHPMQVFSSIDRHGRYAYGNQPDIIVWNMAQLATSLVPLMPDADQAVKDFTAAVHAMPKLLHENWRNAFGAKLGMTSPSQEDDRLIQELLQLMADEKADFTNTFRALTDGTANPKLDKSDAFQSWTQRWRTRIEREEDPIAKMRAANPYIIPRNHQIEAMIQAAVQGDYDPFHRLNALLATPFAASSEALYLTHPPQDAERVEATFCGT